MLPILFPEIMAPFLDTCRDVRRVALPESGDVSVHGNHIESDLIGGAMTILKNMSSSIRSGWEKCFKPSNRDLPFYHPFISVYISTYLSTYLIYVGQEQCHCYCQFRPFTEILPNGVCSKTLGIPFSIL